jgi:stage II sporulation protein P
MKVIDILLDLKRKGGTMKKTNSHYILSIDIATVIKAAFTFFAALLSVFSLVGILTTFQNEYRLSSNSVNKATKNISGAVLYHLFTMENKLFLKEEPKDIRVPSLNEVLFQFATNIKMKDHRSLLGREIPGFSIYDGYILVAGKGTNYTNLPIESEPPKEVLSKDKEAPLKNTKELDTEDKQTPPLSPNEKQTVYLYFTHTHESYLPYLNGVDDPAAAQNSKLNVTKVGEILKNKLEERGIGTYVDKTDVVNLLNKRGWDYGLAYQESRQVVLSAMKHHRDLQYFIDIHRDSQRKNATTTQINGKSYAKIAFIIGAEHPNYEKNAALATELHKRLEKKYPGLSRGVIVKQGKNTNGKFNQDLSSKAFLIEVGGVDNTMDEITRACDAFADAFSDYYWHAEKVNQSGKTQRSKQ